MRCHGRTGVKSLSSARSSMKNTLVRSSRAAASAQGAFSNALKSFKSLAAWPSSVSVVLGSSVGGPSCVKRHWSTQQSSAPAVSTNASSIANTTAAAHPPWPRYSAKPGWFAAAGYRHSRSRPKVSVVASAVPPEDRAQQVSSPPSAYGPQQPCSGHPNTQLCDSHAESFIARAVRSSPVAASHSSSSPLSSLDWSALESALKSRWVTRPLWPRHFPVKAQSPAWYK